MRDTQVNEVITSLPPKYLRQYWLNVLIMNISHKKYKFSEGFSQRTIGEKVAEMSKKVSLRKVKKYIKNVLKEEKEIKKIEKKRDSEFWEKINSSYVDNSTNEDEVIEVIMELKTIPEIENDLPGTVTLKDPKMNEKLHFIETHEGRKTVSQKEVVEDIINQCPYDDKFEVPFPTRQECEKLAEREYHKKKKKPVKKVKSKKRKDK